jgi:UDP-N-acetylglucosamine 2-epimerase (non-hydrolysing)
MQVASTILSRLEEIIDLERPDWVLVQGDTTTVMAAAIAAFYKRIKVGHVEAGLRTHDKWRPFPEEINRRITGVVADLHFAPTENARRNLLCENISHGFIRVTGNTIIDALQWVSKQSLTSRAKQQLAEYHLESLIDAESEKERIILVTAHRRENHGLPIEQICLALKDLAVWYRGQVKIIYPVHPNPNVQEPVYRLLGKVPNIILTPPLDYLPFIHVMKQSYLVLTDSGGLQEEAPGLGKPVLVLRETTERPEGVEAGTVKLIGTNYKVIVRETCRLLGDNEAYQAMATAVNPYGDGKASRRIVEALQAYELKK